MAAEASSSALPKARCRSRSAGMSGAAARTQPIGGLGRFVEQHFEYWNVGIPFDQRRPRTPSPQRRLVQRPHRWGDARAVIVDARHARVSECARRARPGGTRRSHWPAALTGACSTSARPTAADSVEAANTYRFMSDPLFLRGPGIGATRVSSAPHTKGYTAARAHRPHAYAARPGMVAAHARRAGR